MLMVRLGGDPPSPPYGQADRSMVSLTITCNTSIVKILGLFFIEYDSLILKTDFVSL